MKMITLIHDFKDDSAKNIYFEIYKIAEQQNGIKRLIPNAGHRQTTKTL